MLLSIKALNHLGARPDSKNVQHARFLLNYWIYYILISNAENTLLVRTVDASAFQAASVVAFLFKVWLFYGRGCLVLSYYYVSNAFTRILDNTTNTANIDVFEVRFVDPAVSVALMNSVLTNHVLAGLSQVSSFNGLVHSIIASIHQFHMELASSYHGGHLKTPFFLGSSLSFFCTIDNQTVYRQYKLTNRFLRFVWIGNAINTPAINAPKSRGPHPEHHRNLSNHSHRSGEVSPVFSANVSPRMGPQMMDRESRSISEKLEKLEMLEQLERAAERRVASEPRTAETLLASPVDHSTRSRSGSSASQLNMPHNAIPISDLLKRPRTSSIDPPYPVI
ncbi:hypothetical protein PSN45_002221 [Yamadazyma tenuis]|uniref:uncharacterized protein n=1 Tax=Candida tenuis TaxID=2315449 RepID=UPI0027A9DDDD|nr:hypothetical protein PSN45_002221 [Yamadazyma tenuis]